MKYYDDENHMNCCNGQYQHYHNDGNVDLDIYKDNDDDSIDFNDRFDSEMKKIDEEEDHYPSNWLYMCSY